MPEVRVMSPTLASQVAAGEVIERPASVIKELIENSVDAGARKIEVEIQRGGIAMMRVRDDGCGMSPEDAVRSLERHATSKLNCSEDLDGILTLGFRGEALPSVASVSRFSMQTREADSVEGIEVKVEGGEGCPPHSIGCPVGTSIEVRDLFFNVPARKKFLKAETTESAHIDHQIRLHALSTPGIGWVFRKDGKVVLDLPATTDRRVRIEAMTGRESGRSLITVPGYESGGIQVEGAVLPASFARAGRKHQYVFLNGRPVEDAVISRALKEAFKGRLDSGQHPAAWLWISMDPTLVDVNVHPAKKEVRFRDPAKVRIAILAAVEAALHPRQTQPIILESEPTKQAVEAPVLERPIENSSRSRQAEPPLPRSSRSEAAPATHTKNPQVWRSEEQEELAVEKEPKEAGSPNFRIIGSLSKKYALLEGDEGLVLLEPVAARERIIYESLLAREDMIESQGLLVPVLLELDSRDVDLLMRHQEHFEETGFVLEAFGGLTVQISSIPVFLKSDDLRATLIELIDSVLDRHSGGRVRRLAFEGFAAKVAKIGSLQLSWNPSQIPPLLEELFQCDLPYCDPAGRPTLIQISHQELDRKFGKS